MQQMMQDILSEMPASSKHVDRVPALDLPKGPLSTNDQWRSLMWSIDTAQAHGSNALLGLTQALARIIQAEILRGLLFDARSSTRPPSSPDDLLWNSSKPVTADGRSMDDLLSREMGSASLSLAHSAVMPSPWERWRLASAFQNLGPTGKHGVWRQTDNTHAVVWQPWPLAWISNGNHTAMAAIVTHGGVLEVSETLNARDLLQSVYSDGENWIRVADGKRFERVRSLEMAGIFEIGRRLISAPAQV